jgi:hypothetical protein
MMTQTTRVLFARRVALSSPRKFRPTRFPDPPSPAGAGAVVKEQIVMRPDRRPDARRPCGIRGRIAQDEIIINNVSPGIPTWPISFLNISARRIRYYALDTYLIEIGRVGN